MKAKSGNSNNYANFLKPGRISGSSDSPMPFCPFLFHLHFHHKRLNQRMLRIANDAEAFGFARNLNFPKDARVANCRLSNLDMREVTIISVIISPGFAYLRFTLLSNVLRRFFFRAFRTYSQTDYLKTWFFARSVEHCSRLLLTKFDCIRFVLVFLLLNFD